MRWFMCSHCNVEFNKKYNLQRHIMAIHGFGEHEKENDILKKKLSCPHCHFGTRSYNRFETHLTSVHGVESEKQNLRFSNEDEFLKWKEEIEVETCTSFYIRSSQKLQQKSGVVTVTYYRCIRYGHTHTGTGKRASWIKGSCKTGNYCPAKIRRRDEENGVINVSYFGTHTGHGNEIQYLSLPKSVELLIVQKIKDGVDINAILDDIRNEEVTSATLQKKSLLTKKKIYNIIKKYKLSARYHKDDIANVDVLSEKCESMDTNPIVIYTLPTPSHEVEIPVMDDCIYSQLEEENQLDPSEIDIITNQIAQITDLWSTIGVNLNSEEITRNIRKYTSAIIDILLENSDLPDDNQIGNH